MRDLVSIPFTTFEESVTEALNQAGAAEVLARQDRVLIKPNLVSSSPPPVTTPAALCEAIAKYVQEHSKAEVAIAEGTGDSSLETADMFARLGYVEMGRRVGVKLVDLNYAPLKTLSVPGCKVFKEMHLPEMAFTHFIISAPVLKAHSLAEVTGTLKNMMGFPPPAHYGGSWKKSSFHARMQESVMDLNRYILPHLTVMDATVGMQDYHLGGRHCDPPVNRILAGFDPYALDREAARLLGLDWKRIKHIAWDGPKTTPQAIPVRG